MRDKYPMPADAAGIGTASDPESGDVIAIGVVTRRRTYNKTGYICQKDAPAELHACACALLELAATNHQPQPAPPRRPGADRPPPGPPGPAG